MPDASTITSHVPTAGSAMGNPFHQIYQEPPIRRTPWLHRLPQPRLRKPRRSIKNPYQTWSSYNKVDNHYHDNNNNNNNNIQTALPDTVKLASCRSPTLELPQRRRAPVASRSSTGSRARLMPLSCPRSRSQGRVLRNGGAILLIQSVQPPLTALKPTVGPWTAKNRTRPCIRIS